MFQDELEIDALRSIVTENPELANIHGVEDVTRGLVAAKEMNHLENFHGFQITRLGVVLLRVFIRGKTSIYDVNFEVYERPASTAIAFQFPPNIGMCRLL